MEGGEIGLSGDGDWDLRNIPVGFDSEDEEEEKVEIKEEMIVEMMRWLERELNSPRASDHGRTTSYVTINGNEESCGPSFSDSASTVMASIDTRGVGGVAYFVGWPSDPTDVGAATAAAAGVGPWDGKLIWPPAGPAVKQQDEEEDDDEWLARVLGGACFELEMGEEELFL
ncbi:hypothetical protein COCNU_06G001840 [Cocos nucifera]|uniref:Uncharacterized protein n=1 Tax=Cocos nucifera TaxID=13894 RepID=A0A8K0IAJ1_COCNU|nr:hypothetical protein COCNU_06G001840 [Cocos nucifera]